MDNLITDAMMWKLKPDVAISNGFRFCPPITADGNTPTPITNDHIWSMIPVDSEAKYGEATGQQLWDWLEQELHNVFARDPAKRFGGWVVRFKGMTANFTMRAEQGRRVNWIRIGGTPVDLARPYLIAACEREGDPDDTLCRMEKVKTRGERTPRCTTSCASTSRSTRPATNGGGSDHGHRCAAQDLLSQLEGYDYEFR